MRPYFTPATPPSWTRTSGGTGRRARRTTSTRACGRGCSWTEKQYGIPVYANTPAIFVNKTHFKDAGLAPPAETTGRRPSFLDYVTKLQPAGRATGGAS